MSADVGRTGLIFARESIFDPRQGDRSPEEQVQAALAWCQKEDVEPVLVDGEPAILETRTGGSRHSRSAKTGRPKWERAKRIMTGADPATPTPDILITWSSSRTGRRLEGYVELRDICADNGVKWCIDGREWDMTRPEDRAATAYFAVNDEYMADRTNEDVRRAMRTNLAKGKPHGRRLYGFKRIYDGETRALLGSELHPDEAPVVRRIFAEYLAGLGFGTIADRLNAAGVKAPANTQEEKRPARWTIWRVRQVIDTPAYAAKRTHNGEVVRAGDWPPIIEDQVWERAQLRRKAVAGRMVRQTPTSRLLTGVARCSRCNGKMSVRRNRNGTAIYQCRDCKRVSRNLDRLDAFVTAVMLERLSRPDVNDTLAEGEDPAVEAARRRLDELRVDLAEAMELWRTRDSEGKRRLSAAAYADMEADLLPQIAEAEREVQRAFLPIDIDVPPADQVPDWWANDLSPEQRREIIASFVVAVVVHPVGRGRRNYVDAEVTEIEWRR